MVHSFSLALAEAKTEGDISSSRSSSNSTNNKSQTTTTTKPTNTSSHQHSQPLQQQGFGSGNQHQVVNSSEELSHFDFGSGAFGENLHTPTGTTTTTTTTTNQLQANRTTIEKGFSIDSLDKYLPPNHQQQVSSPSPSSDHQKGHHNRSHSWSRYWKAVKRRSGSQLTRLLKMGLKRYYLLLLCLILVIVSCLIASFAISRSVGELDTDDSSGSSSNQEDSKSSFSLGLVKPREHQFEHRTIDLIDLIECGKTFAFTRIRIQVRVPTSSLNFTQRPSFLQQQQSHTTTTNQPSNDDGTSGDGTSVAFHQDQKPVRFILTGARELAQVPDSEQLIEPEAASAEHPLGSGADASSTITSVANPLAMDIKPVTLPSMVAREAAAAVTPPPLKELSALLAASSSPSTSTSASPTTTTNPSSYSSGATLEAASPGEPSSSVIELTGDYQRLDPLVEAASELRVPATSINRTLLDCFVVDTEKRFGQKVSFEDKYRLVASTRLVPFAKMMETLIECRQLTWSSLPPIIRIKQESQAVAAAATTTTTSSEQKPLVAAHSAPIAAAATAAAELEPSSSDRQQFAASGSDFINSMLSSWLHADSPPPPAAPAPAAASESTGFAVAESRQRPQMVTLNGVQEAGDEEKRQGSYLNMGISMVSGIVPNTLWCGLGDRAANYSELGAEFQVDSCCRAHDHCPIRLKPFTTDYGLVNWSVSTRSHCECDLDFNNCLKSINSTLSNVIRVLYFRFVGLQCIDVEGRDHLREAT